MSALSFEEFLNEHHWPWMAEGIRKVDVTISRICAHDEVLTLKVWTDVEALLDLTKQRCVACQSKVEDRFQRQIVEARERAIAEKLPELVGLTERQADFGLVCRDKALLRWGAAGDFRVAAHTIRDASWWIDNRQRALHLKVFCEFARMVEDRRSAAPAE